MFTTVVKNDKQHAFLFNFTFISKNRVETSPRPPPLSPIIRQAAVARTRKAYPQSGRSTLAGREVFLKLNAHWRRSLLRQKPHLLMGYVGFGVLPPKLGVPKSQCTLRQNPLDKTDNFNYAINDYS